MGKLIRCITSDGSIVALGLDSTDIVAVAEKYHVTSAVATAALGRLMSAASMMGVMLKGEKDTITLRIGGGGPLGAAIAVGQSNGDVKGYVLNPVVELPLNIHGKLDVGGAVGTDGRLTVMRDYGFGEPYIGQVPIVSGEIAEDITSYYAASEQIPTVCALGVLVNPDLTVKAAGGLLIQLLPFADDRSIDRLEKNIQNLDSITNMINSGMTPEQICRKALDGFEVEILDTYEPQYRCDCSRERVEKALLTLSEDEMRSLPDEKGRVEVKCHFCNKVYRFNRDELETLIESRKQRTQQDGAGHSK